MSEELESESLRRDVVVRLRSMTDLSLRQVGEVVDRSPSWCRQVEREEQEKRKEKWWQCPSCGGDTRVCSGRNVPTERECVDCEWSFTFPEPPEVPN